MNKISLKFAVHVLRQAPGGLLALLDIKEKAQSSSIVAIQDLVKDAGCEEQFQNGCAGDWVKLIQGLDGVKKGWYIFIIVE